MAFCSLSALVAGLLLTTLSAPASALHSGQQCGGIGAGCTTTAGATCVDGPWGSAFPCESGTYCSRINQYWWQCGRAVDIAAIGTLSWSEEFSGSALDPNTWTHELGDGSAYNIYNWGNNEAECYTNSTANSGIITDTSNGNNRLLYITATKAMNKPCANINSYTNTAFSSSKRDWTSARITTRGKRSFMYAADGSSSVYIEARLKVPLAQGTWPAFWALPMPNEYGSWPSSGELDIMEHINQNSAFTFNVISGSPGNVVSDATAPALDAPADWHTFGIEWTPSYIAWVIDGQEYYRSHSSKWQSGGSIGTGAPFNRPFYILLNMAIGGNYPNAMPSTSGPFTMLVDYVRVWNIAQTATSPSPSPLVSPSPSPSSTIPTCPSSVPVCPASGPYTNCLPPCPTNGLYYYCQAGANANGCKSTTPWGSGQVGCDQQCLYNPSGTLEPSPSPAASPEPSPSPSSSTIPSCPTGLPACPAGGPYTNCLPPCPTNDLYYYCQTGDNQNGCKLASPWTLGISGCDQQCLYNPGSVLVPSPSPSPSPEPSPSPSSSTIPSCPSSSLPTCPVDGQYTNCRPPCPSGAPYYYCQVGNNYNGCKPSSPWISGISGCDQQCLYIA